MNWTEKVHCTPCRGTTDWIVVDGTWTCFHCGAQMRVTEIEKSREK
jgi:ribosomal protein L37AE/L43A